jgi:hypothetical protein
MGEADPNLTEPDGVRLVTPPPELLEKTTLTSVDYQDCFIVDTGPSLFDRSAERWARAIFEDAPAPTRDTLVAGWPLLGLRLGPLGSDEHVLGWLISANSPDQILLSADGRPDMAAELLVERQHGNLRFASFVALLSPAARELWVEVGPRHERTVRKLLTGLRDRTRSAES